MPLGAERADRELCCDSIMLELLSLDVFELIAGA